MRRTHRWAAALALALLLALGPATPGLAATVHHVQWGDSLWKLARWYGTTVEAIQAANGLWDTTIYAGTDLVIPDPEDAYAAAGAAAGITPADLDLLARLVTAEAEGEPYAGQVAVAAVVMNRVRHPDFPDSIAEVIYEPWQFEPVLNGWIAHPATATAIRAVRDALAGWDPSGGALYFFNWRTVSNPFLWSLPWRATIGSHRFVG